jgi:hypothetical protein
VVKAIGCNPVTVGSNPTPSFLNSKIADIPERINSAKNRHNVKLNI